MTGAETVNVDTVARKRMKLPDVATMLFMFPPI
jgi:hypothetical protein